MQHAIVLALDGLSSSILGPYGNTWLETPAFNKLADESLLAQQMIADSPDLESLYQSFWHGTHAAMPAELRREPAPLPEQLAIQDVLSTLISDDETVMSYGEKLGFDEICQVPTLSPAGPASSIAETQLARVFATAVEHLATTLASSERPRLVWIHAAAMRHSWDAPQSIRQQLADEEDPQVPDLVEPPSLFSAEPFDPDTMLGWSQCYAGEVVALDECLNWLLSEMEKLPQLAESMFITTSPRGFPLGVHGHVGNCCPALYADLVQVPTLIRLPASLGKGSREYDLVQSADLFQVVCQWFGIEIAAPCRFGLLNPDSPPNRTGSFSYSVNASSTAIRTPAWFCRFPSEGETELFAKPDDVWEINEVATLRPDVVEAMTLFQEKLQQSYQSSSPVPPELPELLADHWH